MCSFASSRRAEGALEADLKSTTTRTPEGSTGRALSENRQTWPDTRATMLDMDGDFERCYRALQSRDPRFDGWFFAGVSSTGIYCRPSCPALTPRRHNVRFFPTAAAAQGAGYRACKRCRPDVTPGSPEWNLRGDLVARAMNLIADGVVDREGVAGLAGRLHFSARQLQRALVAEVGAGPQALARARRAETARLLIETTELSFAEIAFASGFGSVRQFNDTVRAVFATSPRDLRRRRRGQVAGPGTISLRLPYRAPFDGAALLAFLGARAVAGVEACADGTYRRTLRLPYRHGTVELSLGSGYVGCMLRLEDWRDVTAAVQRCRHLLDLDADPVAIAEVLGRDAVVAGLVENSPGRRVPGSVDGAEMALRAVLGQQVSIAGARALAGRLTASWGRPLDHPEPGLTHLFPEPAVLAGLDPETLPLPRVRGRALTRLARMLATGGLVLDHGADRMEVLHKLRSIAGIGPWTTSYIAMRALGDGDAFPATDLGVRRAFGRLGLRTSASAITRYARAWRPWRSYALVHLWASAGEQRGLTRKTASI
jgi:AraC family transcriptional regulator, regulatory protein of adaptative response / DNA-3-methyladenine glycosylase II